MTTKKYDVTLTFASNAANTGTADPSGGAGTILSGVTVVPLELKGPQHGKDKDFKVTFGLVLPEGMSATIKNFRYYNNGKNTASNLGWWSPDSNVPNGISNQPAVGTPASLPDTTCDPDSPPTNPTNGVITYKGVGSEFEWQTLNNNKLAIKDKNDNVMDYYYVIEVEITAPENLAGVYVNDPKIKNW